MRRADRLLRITHFLRSRKYAVTAKVIAEEFGISTRTVYRDIQDLIYTGAPIEGEAGVGYLMNKDYYLPPLTFDKDELEAITLGISVIRQWTDDQFAQKAALAFDKIQAALPKDLQGEIDQLTTVTAQLQDGSPWQNHFSDIRECIRHKKIITIRYCDGEGNITQRSLRPLALVFFGPVWLLAAWCEKREDFRNFRLDRIQSIKILDEIFEDENNKNLNAYRKIERCF